MTEEGRLNHFIQFNPICAFGFTSWDHLVLNIKVNKKFHLISVKRPRSNKKVNKTFNK